MSKLRAKHKRQTRSQAACRYESSSSEGEESPNMPPQDTCQSQDVGMDTDNAQAPAKEAGTPDTNKDEAMETNPPSTT
ncbi:hypothetical protein DSO57_1009477 [Entomophthora muscae]|uniref:Uncharacterized protein n=1 Tax=Entomophthora muscae TaxID=34485 RepID=A0ACC2UFS3_9FUNG|nr:hypothetical protein DSO57_1009477 [Entomophthora muscae]